MLINDSFQLDAIGAPKTFEDEASLVTWIQNYMTETGNAEPFVCIAGNVIIDE